MTETRPIQPTTVGAFRFNTDSAKLEYFDGDEYVNITTDSSDANTGGGRALFGGGCTSPGGSDDRHVNTIDFVNISTTGSATDFGDLSYRTDFPAACASRTRGFWSGGTDPGTAGLSELDTVIIASQGTATDFGENINHRGGGGLSDQTRGIFHSTNGGTNTIHYITMATTGTVEDFGDNYVAAASGAGLASPTRGVMAGGDAPAYTNVIQYLTISTTGNTADFGDLSTLRGYVVGASSATRGLLMSGYNPSPGTNMNIIQFVTIATSGDATDFGDLTEATRHSGGASSCTRAVHSHGYSFSGDIDYVTISTTGDAVDFGDQSQTRRGMAGCSNAHGGLG